MRWPSSALSTSQAGEREGFVSELDEPDTNRAEDNRRIRTANATLTSQWHHEPTWNEKRVYAFST
jgi:hypothetical protein